MIQPPIQDGIMIPLEQPTQDPNQLQQRASNPKESVWVSASAGSGKTKVLSDRVIRLLLDGTEPQRLLCLTFTRAGAAEMANRVTKILGSWATCSEEKLREDLSALQGEPPTPQQMIDARRLFARVLSCPGGMRIRTIHAFCQEILYRFPLEASVAPNFTLLDDNEAKVIHYEARAKLLKKATKDQTSPEGVALQKLVSEIAEETFINHLQAFLSDQDRINRLIDKHGSLDALIEELFIAAEMTQGETKESFLTRISDDAHFDPEGLREAAKLKAEAGTATDKKQAELIFNFLSQKPKERVASWEIYKSAFLTQDNEIRATLLKKNLQTSHPDIHQILEVEAARILSIESRLDTLTWLEKTAAFLTLSTALAEEITIQKQHQGCLDYDDLISKVEKLLDRPDIAPWVLYKLDGGLDHILVDEAQDTSPSQWRIVEKLLEAFFDGEGAGADKNRTLFVVGDEKQSIFSFQKADPEAFLRMHKIFADRIRASQKDLREVPMSISFRSSPVILKAVDAVFKEDRIRQGVSETRVHHQAFHAAIPGCVELWPLAGEGDEENKKTASDDFIMPLVYELDQNTERELAYTIADKIKTWLQEGASVYDRKQNKARRLEPNDIMVLVQRRKAFVYHLVRALKECDVAVTGVDRMHLTSQLAVKDCLALLNFLLLPEDDLNCATLLKTPMIGFDDDDLMALAIDRPSSIWQNLVAKAEIEGKWQAAVAYLKHFLARTDRISPFALLTECLLKPCPADSISGRRAIWKRLGSQALDPLDELLSAAQDFALRHAPSLQDFLAWIMEADTEIKREMDQGAGEVRIATVHASKGLEAPIIILADASHIPSDQKLPVLLWQEKDNLPFFISRRPKENSLKTLRDKARTKQLEEYRRLLYVAMTRPSDRLYVCGTKKKSSAEKSWYDIIKNALEQDAPLTPENPQDPTTIKTLPKWSDPIPNNGEEGNAPEPTEKEIPSLPSWSQTEPPEEPTPPKPLMPSRDDDEDDLPTISPRDKRFLRGRLIHRLLQSLPDMPPNRRAAAAQSFMAKNAQDLAAPEQKIIIDEVMAILTDPNFAPIFTPDSLAEVPIVGRVGERLISGQVDRLCMYNDEIWIIDYKSNRPPPMSEAAIAPLYRRQLEAYKTVLQSIYKGKTIRSFLLWTYTPTLIEVKPSDS